MDQRKVVIVIALVAALVVAGILLWQWRGKQTVQEAEEVRDVFTGTNMMRQGEHAKDRMRSLGRQHDEALDRVMDQNE